MDYPATYRRDPPIGEKKSKLRTVREKKRTAGPQPRCAASPRSNLLFAMHLAASHKTKAIARNASASAINRASVQAPENALSVGNAVESAQAAVEAAELPEMATYGTARSTQAAQSSAMAKLNEFIGFANGIIPE